MHKELQGKYKVIHEHMEVSLNYCSQNGGTLYRAPYYKRNVNIGPRIDSNLGQSPGFKAESRSIS